MIKVSSSCPNVLLRKITVRPKGYKFCITNIPLKTANNGWFSFHVFSSVSTEGAAHSGCFKAKKERT